MPSGDRPRRLRVGSLEATFDDGGLRWISFDGVEILRGILLTARDADWRTLRPEIRGLRAVTEADGFSIAFDAHWHGERFEVDGHVAFEGDRTGLIEARFTAHVEAETVVQRIGLIVLHPASVAGRPFEATHEIGPTLGEFPVLVTADRFMTEIRAMRWEPAADLRASLKFDGDLWETEDQRAWTDASFKSYSPPLSRPHPVTLATDVTLEAGIRMEVARTGEQPGRVTRSRRAKGERITVQDETLATLPPIGLGWSGPLRSDEAARLHSLHPAHLRVVLDRTRDDWRPELRGAAQDALAVGTALQLELVAFADDKGRDDLAGALGALHVPIAGALVFGTVGDAGLVTSEASAVGAMRDRLRAVVPGIEVGGGSRVNYAELAAASAQPLRSLDTIAFAVTPQIHAADAATVIENLATLPVLMESAAVLSGGRPLDVLCSFRPRFDAYATPAERRQAPTRFDDRLADDLGSAWLIGTLAGVLLWQTGRVTILEASGPAGVLRSGDLVATLEAVMSMGAGQVLRVETTEGCAALAIRSQGRLRVIIANLLDRVIKLSVALPMGWHPRDGTGGFDLAPLHHLAIDAGPG